MFGVQPMMGRFLTPQEMEPGHDQVAVIGHRLWQMRYGSDPSILGKTIDLDRKGYTIVGVMAASFRFTWDQEMDVFVPLALTPDEQSEAGNDGFTLRVAHGWNGHIEVVAGAVCPARLLRSAFFFPGRTLPGRP